MEFRETLLAAQRNQRQKSSAGNAYYKARFDPPKKEKEMKPKDRLSANIQKFLAKKEEEERQKEIEAKRKRDELMSMRDSKAMNKIRKTLKVIKSANKSVLSDAIDTENTAFTLEGPHQPDQDDYGYESQEAAAIYQKMMEKYSKIPEESKFPKTKITAKKDIQGTRERVKNALQHADDPVPHKKRKRKDGEEVKEYSPPPTSKPDSDKRREEKPKVRKPMPPPMDFNQLLKLAEEKKKEHIEPLAVPKKVVPESENLRPMTKKQKKEYEEEMARKLRRQQLAAGKKVPPPSDAKPPQDRERKPEVANRIPKVGDRDRNGHRDRPEKTVDKDRLNVKTERGEQDRGIKKEKMNDMERLDRLKLKNNHIDNKNRSSPHLKMESRDKMNVSKDNYKKNIELKSQNTYRIDKNGPEKKPAPISHNRDKMNSYSSQGKHVPKTPIIPNRDDRDKGLAKQKSLFRDNSPKLNGKQEIRKPPVGNNNNKVPLKRPDERKLVPNERLQPSTSKPKMSNSFDFDKHINSLGKSNASGSKGFKRSDDRKKPVQKRRIVDSEEDSDMDDFIDDGDQEEDYSKHIKEIFGYDKSRYRDDDDDPDMESSFARQMREEYISKRIGIMEDLEDMKMEAMEKKLKGKKRRRISDDSD